MAGLLVLDEKRLGTGCDRSGRMSRAGDLNLLDEQRLEPGWAQHLDLIAPGEQVPGQLAHAAAAKANHDRAVRLRLDRLVGVEAPPQRALRRGWQDAQGHVLGVILVDAEA